MEGSRSSNVLRHLHKGFLPTICSQLVLGYMVFKCILDKSMFNINVGDYFLITSGVLFFANTLAKPFHFFFWFYLFIFC